MATNEIKLGINLRQNKNSKNAGYGKYYPEVDTQTTLTLRGFAKHMTDHGSIYSFDLIEGVLKKITQCLPELISQGVPVRLDPLGTFLPTCDVDKPLLNIAAMEGADPNEVVKAVHIRFLPYGVEDENITSRRFKEEYCSLEFRNIIDTQEVTVDGRKKKVTTLKPVATAIAEWKVAYSGDSGSSTGSETVTVEAPVISGETSFDESTQVSISAPDGAEIRYTTDGTTPNAQSSLYSEAITLTDTATVKAIAIKNGTSSEMTIKVFTKNGSNVGTGGFETGN